MEPDASFTVVNFPFYNARVRPVIILFAKVPVPGRVKTRLSPPLSPDAAARLHSAFVADMLEKIEPLGDIELHTDVSSDAWPEYSVTRKTQVEGDLGIKMLSALTGALASGRPRAMIVGADAPTLPPAHLQALLESAADVALGPAEDGGYYAISCRRAHPDMFRGVAWSMAATLADTARAAAAVGLSVATGPAWYDVDAPEDLDRLRREQGLPRHTANALGDQVASSL